jgi:hypothetical protein
MKIEFTNFTPCQRAVDRRGIDLFRATHNGAKSITMPGKAMRTFLSASAARPASGKTKANKKESITVAEVIERIVYILV